MCVCGGVLHDLGSPKGNVQNDIGGYHGNSDISEVRFKGAKWEIYIILERKPNCPTQLWLVIQCNLESLRRKSHGEVFQMTLVCGSVCEEFFSLLIDIDRLSPLRALSFLGRRSWTV